MSARAQRFVLAAILLLAGHLYFTAVRETVLKAPIPDGADAMDYASYASNLARYGVYSRDQCWIAGRTVGPPQPDALRSPGYPLLLVPLLGTRLPDASFVLKAQLVQAMVGVALAALAYALARRFLGTAGALGCAALTAITPHLVTSATYLLSEVWFTFWMLLGLVGVVTGARRAGGWSWALFLGAVALGIAALVRPTLQTLPLFFVPALFFPERRFMRAAAFLLGFGLAFGPWLVRNEVTLGRLGDPTLSIAQLHHGSYPHFMYRERPETLAYPYLFDPDTPAIARSVPDAVRHVVDELRRDPIGTVRWYALEKPFYLFGWDPIQGQGDVFVYEVAASPYLGRPEFVASKALMFALHWPLMLGGLAGALAVWVPRFARTLDPAQRDGARLVSLLFLSVVATAIVGAPWPRYSVPLRPLSYLFALLLLSRVWPRRAPVAA